MRWDWEYVNNELRAPTTGVFEPSPCHHFCKNTPGGHRRQRGRRLTRSCIDGSKEMLHMLDHVCVKEATKMSHGDLIPLLETEIFLLVLDQPTVGYHKTLRKIVKPTEKIFNYSVCYCTPTGKWRFPVSNRSTDREIQLNVRLESKLFANLGLGHGGLSVGPKECTLSLNPYINGVPTLVLLRCSRRSCIT